MEENNVNSLCLKFKNEMYKEFPKLDFGIVIYGSNILDVNSSDLDVCIICDNLCAEDKEKITKKLLSFIIKIIWKLIKKYHTKVNWYYLIKI